MTGILSSSQSQLFIFNFFLIVSTLLIQVSLNSTNNLRKAKKQKKCFTLIQERRDPQLFMVPLSSTIFLFLPFLTCVIPQ